MARMPVYDPDAADSKSPLTRGARSFLPQNIEAIFAARAPKLKAPKPRASSAATAAASGSGAGSAAAEVVADLPMSAVTDWSVRLKGKVSPDETKGALNELLREFERQNLLDEAGKIPIQLPDWPRLQLFKRVPWPGERDHRYRTPPPKPGSKTGETLLLELGFPQVRRVTSLHSVSHSANYVSLIEVMADACTGGWFR